MPVKVGTKIVMMKSVDQILKDKGLDPGGSTRKFATETWAELIDPYTPFKTGALKEGGAASIRPPYTRITYNQPYARRMYYGETFNFNGAPMRGYKWDQRAINAGEAQKLADRIQEHLNRGKR